MSLASIICSGCSLPKPLHTRNEPSVNFASNAGACASLRRKGAHEDKSRVNHLSPTAAYPGTCSSARSMSRQYDHQELDLCVAQVQRRPRSNNELLLLRLFGVISPW